MRRVLVTTDDSHPDVPDDIGVGAALNGPLVWQVYIDGTPFIGVPSSQPLAREQAEHHASQIVATGRYEYVDVRLRPDRRLSQRRVQWARRGDGEAASVGGRRRGYGSPPRRRFDNPLDQSTLRRDCTPWLAS